VGISPLISIIDVYACLGNYDSRNIEIDKTKRTALEGQIRAGTPYKRSWRDGEAFWEASLIGNVSNFWNALGESFILSNLRLHAVSTFFHWGLGWGTGESSY